MDASEGASQMERRVDTAVVGAMAASSVHAEKAIVGAVAARGDVTIDQGICGPVAAVGDVEVRNGFCGPVAAIGGARLERMATQSVVSLGRVEIGERAFVGIVLAPFATLNDGARVLMNTRQALAFGAVAGVVAGAILRRRRQLPTEG
ncbi:MAG: hypothetical protein ACM3OO_01140 [Planctomycetaceae bacterium]